MEPTFLQILFLGIVQGAAELLPVSSSAHVIVAEKLLGLDPSSPSMTFLLVMLHTGTMVAVILYFWNAWKRTFFSNAESFRRMILHVGSATVMTLLVGFSLKLLIEKVILRGTSHDEMEDLFGHLPLVGSALLAAGLLILAAGYLRGKNGQKELTLPSSLWIGASQGICLPFRGLSRSGTTISADLFTVPMGATHKKNVEELINFYYDPANAAMLAAWVNYVTPVVGAKEEAMKIDPALAENQLIFPSEDFLKNAHGFRSLTGKEELSFTKAFQEVLLGA
jgi:undecaprenyl pyrophosphate phosphatase UppP